MLDSRRLKPDGTSEMVKNEDLKVGDMIELRAGERVPADGIVRKGTSSLDLASLTGESVPVEVHEGGHALAGAMNIDGLLQVELTRVGEESTIGKIITLMREAENAKPPVTRLLDRYAGQYMALVLLVAGRRLAHQRQRACDARGARRVVPVRARARGARDGRRSPRSQSRRGTAILIQGLRIPRPPRGRIVRDLRQDGHNHDRRPASRGSQASGRRRRHGAAPRRGEPRRWEQPSAEPCSRGRRARERALRARRRS